MMNNKQCKLKSKDSISKFSPDFFLMDEGTPHPSYTKSASRNGASQTKDRNMSNNNSNLKESKKHLRQPRPILKDTKKQPTSPWPILKSSRVKSQPNKPSFVVDQKKASRAKKIFRGVSSTSSLKPSKLSLSPSTDGKIVFAKLRTGSESSDTYSEIQRRGVNIQNQYRIHGPALVQHVGSSKPMSCDKDLPLVAVSQRNRKVPTVVYRSRRGVSEIDKFIDVLPAVYDPQHAMGLFRDVQADYMKSLASETSAPPAGAFSTGADAVDIRSTIKSSPKKEMKLQPGGPSLVPLGPLPPITLQTGERYQDDADLAQKYRLAKMRKEPLGFRLRVSQKFPDEMKVTEDKQFRHYSQNTPKRISGLSDGALQKIESKQKEPGATRKHESKHKRLSFSASYDSQQQSISNQSLISKIRSGMFPGPHASPGDSILKNRAVSSAFGMSISRSFHEPRKDNTMTFKVKITPGSSGGENNDTSNIFDNFNPVYLSISQVSGEGRDKKNQDRIRRVHQREIDASKRLGRTVPTQQQYAVDFNAQQRQAFTQDTHSAFSQVRLATSRRSPALIVWPRQRADPFLLGQSYKQQTCLRTSSCMWPQSKNELRLDACDRGNLRFYPWAPFDQAKVNATCDFVVTMAERANEPKLMI